MRRDLRPCPHCNGRFRVLKHEDEYTARHRHESTSTCLAATVHLFAMEVGWVRATDTSVAIKKAGLPVRYLPTSVGDARPVRNPWAPREAVEAAKVLRRVRVNPKLRKAWLLALYDNAKLRRAAKAARRLGGERAVLALMRSQP